MTSDRRQHARLMWMVFGSGVPAFVAFAVLLAHSGTSVPVAVAVALSVIAAWLGVLLLIRSRTRYHLSSVSNLLAALREGDYSFRVRNASREDPFGELVLELNLLAATLRRQRVDDLEALALVQTAMGEIDVAVFAFDHGGRLRQTNEAGIRVLGGESESIGRSAAELGLQPCLDGEAARTVELEMGGAVGRWEMRRGAFRQHGRPHRLVILSDVSRALRAEELDAWRRLIRVIGHELNNSLAPIKSLSGSMSGLVATDPLPADWKDDIKSGLEVIGSRAEALNRFMSAYSRLAKMPPPKLRAVDVGALVRGVATLETRLAIDLEEGPETVIRADQDQLEQLLINVTRNAVEASLETGGAVSIGWTCDAEDLQIVVRDRGPGLPRSANLFVPFFTTKPGGSGIGLFLCRLVAEAHSGSVSVENRSDGGGCKARITLPLAAAP